MTTFESRAGRAMFGVRLMFSAAAALMLTACSQSFDRFSENPSDTDPVYTASAPRKPATAADDGTISSRPLANANLRQPGTGYNYSQPYQPSYKAPAYADSQAPAFGAGGTVTITPGMTLYSVARANGITVAELASYNGLTPPYSVRSGQVLRIPGGGDAVTPTRSASLAAPATAERQAGGSHTVSSGETLFSLGRAYGVSPYAIADLNGFAHDQHLAVGQRVKIPGAGTMAATTTTKKKVAPATDEIALTDEEAPAAPATTLKKPKQVASLNDDSEQATTEEAPAVETPAKPAEGLGLRWPVRGKVISSYGPKPNGLKNEGINIAVPEGTSVRAAESGVVAYAGNELKGYGNLVLIRHDGGYVTAYAHAKELFVKRGDTVNRGDVIAKAGQTGSVSSPQLHFEVRKGATALDPLKFLSSATASN
ncbi:MAG: LysM peptidoglycan-binding domain-containing M23 family metallopeptidase [Alphaproteobacteria bacterium]|nr:LysM peptidoglycan-binding domain-containing M23 family metallopeptidase [Alphaproteobacteria bacterium]